MVEIEVDGFTCILDEEYLWLVQKLRLKAVKVHKNMYVYSGNTPLHKIIYYLANGEPEKGYVIDHVNRNSLDNRSINLRLLSSSQNYYLNRAKRRGTSRYIGVSKDRRNNKWRAQCVVGANNIYLGLYNDETSAAIAHDMYAVTNFKNPLRLNFPEEFYELQKVLNKDT